MKKRELIPLIEYAQYGQLDAVESLLINGEDGKKVDVNEVNREGDNATSKQSSL